MVAPRSRNHRKTPAVAIPSGRPGRCGGLSPFAQRKGTRSPRDRHMNAGVCPGTRCGQVSPAARGKCPKDKGGAQSNYGYDVAEGQGGAQSNYGYDVAEGQGGATPPLHHTPTNKNPAHP